ncbi:MAG: carboxypeptidase-like regulatory domain-containing protein, partial [Bacteroidales bacterium]|nr:carboxypeptidase-like regulatory domain-containing protein [Bacteroidales bacterium]
MKILSLIIVVFLASFSFAQNPSQKPSNMQADGSLSGIVLEKGSNQAVEYANIVIYSKKDSSIVTGGITDRNGHFKINNISYGRFYVEVNFIGYGKHVIQDLNINQNRKDVNLGKIFLSVDAHILDEVSIEANVNQVEYKLDRKVVNVNQDIISAGA